MRGDTLGRWKPLLLAALMLFSLLPAMAVHAGGGRAASHAVDIENFAYDPQDITVFVGDSVVWTNLDSNSHTVTSTSGPESFDSGIIPAARTFTFTFTSPGAYEYRCTLHSQMTGSVTVEHPPALRVRESETTFTWQPEAGEGQPTNVSLIGEWDWATHADLTFDAGSGSWSTSMSLQPGMYCYKFVIGENDYRFDANNPYRGFCGAFENSIVRIDDTSNPALSLASSASGDGFTARILFWAGDSGSPPDTFTTTLTHDFIESTVNGIWNSDDWSLTFFLDSLSPGKYTLRATATDLDGGISEELLVPFWVGEQADFIWDDALIYMLMTDRFVNGDASNDPASTNASQGAGWQGGDFAGVTQMIQSGYFDDLGVNALWLTPFNSAANGTELAGDGQHRVSGYHGYWPVEPRAVDSRLGTDAELEALVSAAHSHGIRVLMDYVVNHVHEDHPYSGDHPDWFTQGCLCGSEDCDWTEHRLDCLFRTYMPDLDWKNRDASEQMIADGLWWLERFDLDGARIDAVKHVDDLAVHNFATQVEERFETGGVDYYLKGETAIGWAGHDLAANQGEYDMINRYMGEHALDGQADFVLYHAVVDNVFTSGAMDYQHLDYARSQDQYVDGATMVPFIGSHDSSRFISRADPGTADEWNKWVEDGLPGQPGTDDPYTAALQAFAWLLTTPGAPMVYMGDEYGEYGGADPDNRHMLRDSSGWNEQEAALHENISLLGSIRAQQEPLRRGTYTSLHNASDTLAYAMQTVDDAAVVILNRGPATQVVFDLSGVAGDWSNPDNDLVANRSMSVDASGAATVSMEADTVAIFSSVSDDQTEPPTPEEPHLVDILVIYPQSADVQLEVPISADMMFGETTMGGFLDAHFEVVSGIFANSGIPAVFNISGHEQINFSHIDDDWKDKLSSVLMNSGLGLSWHEPYLEEIEALRSDVEADIVIYWRQSGDGGPGSNGAAVIPATEGEAYIQLNFAGMNPRIVAHEIGHLFGGRHEVGMQGATYISLDGGDAQLREYRTIMTSREPLGLGNAMYVRQFSDKNVTVHGNVPCSTSSGSMQTCTFIDETSLGNSTSDNLPIIIQMAPIIAGFRPTGSGPEPVWGCTDSAAENHDPAATHDDGSCTYPPPVPGCTDPEAENFDPEATEDDGSCTFPPDPPGPGPGNGTDNQTGNQTGNLTGNQTGNLTGNQTDNQTTKPDHVGEDNGTTGDEPADDAGDAQGSGGIDASVIRWALAAAAIVAVLAFVLMTLSRRD